MAGEEMATEMGASDAVDTGATAEMDVDYKQENTEIKAALKKANNEAAKFRKRADKYKGIDLEKYNALIEKEAELKQHELDSEKNLETYKQKYAESVASKHEAELAEIRALNEQLRNNVRSVTVTNTITSEASKQNAVAPDEIVTLLQHKVSLDDNNVPFIPDGDGGARYHEGHKMTIGDLVKEYLDKNPRQVKAAQRPGSSGEQPRTPGSLSLAKIGNMSTKEYSQNRDAVMAALANKTLQ
jgi:hypothetical protein